MSKVTTEEFIDKAKKVHGDSYTYKNANYIHSLKPITITCPIHGDFEQLPSNHLRGSICKKCSVSFRTMTKEQFIEKANQIHFFKYDYTKVMYKTNKKHVLIICPIHGEFTQTPNSHLAGQECPACGRLKCDEARKYTQEEFIEKAGKVHNKFYSYEFTEYQHNRKEILITCPIHGPFKKTPTLHLRGQGCHSCAMHGFDKTKPAILYYLRISTTDSKFLYKIGITNRTVTERFNLTELSKIEVIKLWEYDTGEEAYNKEQEILEDFKEFKYSGKNVLVNGNTELFTKNILNL